MTTFTPTANDLRSVADEAKTTTKKRPVTGGPVLMADCITPVGGETLLSLLWKRWDQED